jgi:HK97 family phage portal protein
MPFMLVNAKSGELYDDSADWQNKVGYLPDPASLFAQVEMALCIWGGAYLFKERNRARLLDLRYIVPTTITPELDPVKGLTGFERATGDRIMRLEPDDLIYIWQADPWVELGPPQSSRYKAAMSAAGLLHALDAYEAEFVRRGGVLPTMLMVKGMPSQAEREKLESYWDKFIKGFFRVAGKIFNAEAFDVRTVGEGLSNVKDSNFTEIQRQNIAAAFGVPLSWLMSNAANYATALADRRVFWENTVLPECEFISDTLNEQLFLPSGLRMVWKPETVDAFQTDEQARAVAYATYVSSGMTPSTAAQVVGIELPEGIEYTDLDKQRQETALPAPEETPAVVAAAQTEARREARRDIAQDVKALTIEAWRDLEIWRRMAVKAIGRTGSADIPFVSSHIPADEMGRIADGLRLATTADQVKAVFDGQRAEARQADVLEAIRLGVEALRLAGKEAE